MDDPFTRAEDYLQNAGDYGAVPRKLIADLLGEIHLLRDQVREAVGAAQPLWSGDMRRLADHLRACVEESYRKSEDKRMTFEDRRWYAGDSSGTEYALEKLEEIIAGKLVLPNAR